MSHCACVYGSPVCPTVRFCKFYRDISAILWSGPKIRMLVIVDLSGYIIEIVTLCVSKLE